MAPAAPQAPAPQAAPAPGRPARTRDPVVGWLTLAIILVIIIWLVSMLSAIMFGLLKPPTAPRTAAERDLMSMSATVQSGKASTQVYARYIGVLISAGKLNRAQQALDQAMKTAKTDKSFLYAQQAQLDLAQQDYKGTVTSADQAMAAAEKELKAFMALNVANNRKAEAGATIPTSYTDAALAKAEALAASKDYKGAIKSFDAYLKIQSTDSDILVQRALAKVSAGDKTGAEADYRAALKYIPDYQPAIDGLKKMGVAR
jgi:tetratricopeptide (TPR) repeat protein